MEKMRKLIFYLSLLFITSCTTVRYIKSPLPDFNPGRVNYKEFDKNDTLDMRNIIGLQQDIIEKWENFYKELREEYGR